jgi:hypothetical protein
MELLMDKPGPKDHQVDKNFLFTRTVPDGKSQVHEIPGPPTVRKTGRDLP